MRTGFINILTNVFLATFKIIVGVAVNSIAITLDAVNNISDAMSSVITLVGTKLASKKPNKKHPLGYVRVEYLSAIIVSVVILYAGTNAFVEGIKKIINPEEIRYTSTTMIIVGVGIVVKLILGNHVRKMGKKPNLAP